MAHIHGSAAGHAIDSPAPSAIKIARIINYLFVILEGLIALRFVFKLLGGNPGNPFVSFIYSVTFPFVYPFLTAFNNPSIDTGIGTVELGSALAIAFYILLNYAIVKLIRILATPNHIDNEEDRV